jgi:hypothetical protein
VVTARQTLAAAGAHTLHVWMVDPGVVVQKIVAETTASGRGATYLGPPESYRGTGSSAR